MKYDDLVLVTVCLSERELKSMFFIFFLAGVVALFTLPKVYETNKAQIDQNVALVHGKINELTAK